MVTTGGYLVNPAWVRRERYASVALQVVSDVSSSLAA